MASATGGRVRERGRAECRVGPVRPARGWLWTLFPPTCVLCGAHGMRGLDLCAGCFAELPRQNAACRICARGLPRPGVCGACQQRPPAFDEAVAGFAYDYPVDWLVRRFKFAGCLDYGRVLSESLARALVEQGAGRPEAIMPVPLHRRRLRERGFDQSVEIGRLLGRRLGVPLFTGRLKRRRATAQQAALSARERRRNLRDAFAVRGSVPASVALVDDVMTTGSTASECARALKQAGCDHVGVWVLARA